MYEYHILGKMIFEDLQNNLLEKYSVETGKEPVPEEGGHTQDFEEWFCKKCELAEKAGCKTAKEALDFINRS